MSGEVHHSLSANLVHQRLTFSWQEIYFLVCLHYVAAYNMKSSPPLLAFLLEDNPWSIASAHFGRPFLSFM